ncbi:adhesion G-protein coupled receptor D1 [Acipenser oxyrinchus oxyrinchus]|uniref:Adhesion G-protein coupled receptor D1 n=1 Tax=Acipenser oxyrinchus oxyrinchus TaxID=40147 RepID=A0AAD8CE66_ACIOX|nr:adhesion G-protein coupled receptor D1 [Acipenser oxyrinchus oxyrinchus]
MEKLCLLFSITTFLALIPSHLQVSGQYTPPSDHPGFQVLASASHYWPLDAVDGIYGLWDAIGNRTGHVNGSSITLRIHNHTVLLSHNPTSVYTNDSAYTNLTATVDIVEGMVNRGIYLNGDAGATFLHFGSYENSCISDPALCGPQGVTFSFFWKNLESLSRFAMASGGKVISNGFSIYSNGFADYVEFYTRGDSRTWRAKITPPGPHWTHILFTWTLNDGLKVYVNGTFSTNDTQGRKSQNYGDPYHNLIIGADNDQSYGHYVTGAFDEFVIWERALNPEEIELYYKAAIGEPVIIPTTAFVQNSTSSPVDLMLSTDAYHPIITNLTVEIQHFQYPVSMLGYLESVSVSLPNKTIPKETASNLTETFLKSVEEVLLLPSWPELAESAPVVSGLIETVDNVMVHMVYNLEPSPFFISIDGSSTVADYSLVKLPLSIEPASLSLPFKQGRSYITIPGKAFNFNSRTTIVGLFYHTMHNYYKKIDPLKTKLSLPCTLCQLVGHPLITIVLTHVLSLEQYSLASNSSNTVFLYCAFLDYSSGLGVWSNEGCVRAEGNLTFSMCLCNHLTNFAILMQVVPLELSNVNQVALSTISYIGCTISIFCLAITIVTFAILSSVSTIRNQRYHIHANLSFAILVAQILLLISFRFDSGTQTHLLLRNRLGVSLGDLRSVCNVSLTAMEKWATAGFPWKMEQFGPS